LGGALLAKLLIFRRKQTTPLMFLEIRDNKVIVAMFASGLARQKDLAGSLHIGFMCF
jgi:hypothetical protein